jgi:hypothetical protein
MKVTGETLLGVSNLLNYNLKYQLRKECKLEKKKRVILK